MTIRATYAGSMALIRRRVLPVRYAPAGPALTNVLRLGDGTDASPYENSRKVHGDLLCLGSRVPSHRV